MSMTRWLRTALASLFLALGVAGWPLVAQQPATPPIEGAFRELFISGGGDRAIARVLTDSTESWFARWHLLTRAKKSIDVSYFILKDDIFGRSMLGLLRARAREGLAVRLMLDGRGSGKLARSSEGYGYLRALMQEPNVQVRIYRPLAKSLLTVPLNVRNALASNHDKIFLIDGEWLITGGRNIATEYFAQTADLPKVFRDTDIVLKSALIGARARTAFDEEFARWDNSAVREKPFDELEDRRMELEAAWRAMNARLLAMEGDTSRLQGTRLAPLLEQARAELDLLPALRSGPVGSFAGYEPFQGDRPVPVVLLDKHSRLGKKNEITAGLVRLIDASSSDIHIQNPYIVLTRTAREALGRASARGVKIVINTNGPTSYDHLVTQATFLREWKGLLKELPTCRLFAYNGPAMIHAKVFTFDDRVAVVGSYNMDPLSEQINSEAVCVVQSPDFARRNRLRVEADLKSSEEWSLPAATGPEGMAAATSTPAGPPAEAVQGALKLLTVTGVATLIRPLM